MKHSTYHEASIPTQDGYSKLVEQKRGKPQ